MNNYVSMLYMILSPIFRYNSIWQFYYYDFIMYDFKFSRINPASPAHHAFSFNINEKLITHRP